MQSLRNSLSVAALIILAALNATRVAAEAMHLVDGESVLIADDAPAFAEAIARLARDQVLWQRLSDGGIRVMETHFVFDAAEQALRHALDLEGNA